MTAFQYSQLGNPWSEDFANMFDFILRVDQRYNLQETRKINPNTLAFEEWVRKYAGKLKAAFPWKIISFPKLLFTMRKDSVSLFHIPQKMHIIKKHLSLLWFNFRVRVSYSKVVQSEHFRTLKSSNRNTAFIYMYVYSDWLFFDHVFKINALGNVFREMPSSILNLFVFGKCLSLAVFLLFFRQS